MKAALMWDERFGQEDYVYGKEPNAFLKSSLGYLPETGRVLCLAEGEGRNGVFLAKQGYDVHAIDISTAGKEKAEKLATENGVAIDYVVSDVNDYDFGEEKWDAIISISAHTDPETRGNVYRKVLPALKENGVFFLEAYHPNQLLQGYGTGGPKEASWMVSLEDLLAFFPVENVLHQAEMERDVREGKFHTGKAFVTQFVWKK